ncbi:hypothetical protein [Larkinella rosea]|uniref:Uncharacterized protein n=1 Tax=Larkinella rosea TaxID=2025312 RepID=A0A3P1BTU8_9BACT|nr:hypothetical protein [Larkinella rosea]RRB04538.1 hypothetical protein EHT25_13670 [Larkinella rosea]
MKNGLLLLLATSLLCIQCSLDKPVIAPKIDKEKASIQLMKELVPQLTGTWTIRQLQIKYQHSQFQNELKIRKDTILTNFATLTLARASQQIDATRDRYQGYIQYGPKTYPIRFDLLAGPWIFSKKGPKAYFLLEYNFPVGTSHSTEKEEYFLQQIGLLLENFSLETAKDSMIWHGLNRGIAQIDLIRK